VCADIRDGREQLLSSKGRIQMSKTNYLQAVKSDLQRTAGPYRCANFGSSDAHSMTSSVRIMTVGGTVKFESLAVLRLTTSSNLVGCSTGMSAGFAPFRMRSTISAPRRHCASWSVVCGEN